MLSLLLVNILISNMLSLLNFVLLPFCPFFGCPFNKWPVCVECEYFWLKISHVARDICCRLLFGHCRPFGFNHFRTAVKCRGCPRKTPMPPTPFWPATPPFQNPPQKWAAFTVSISITHTAPLNFWDWESDSDSDLDSDPDGGPIKYGNGRPSTCT